MEFGKKIRSLRLKAGLTQEQLADRIGIGAQAVSKWENSAAMPDIAALPTIAEIFGVSIDDLFDLTAEQRLNRIENRLDLESELPQDVFREYEDYLASALADEATKKRATGLTAYLWWHRMNAAAEKVRRYAKEAIRMDPGTKDCQWMLIMAEGHAAWDWNFSNHGRAIDFYRGITEEHPDLRLPWLYLIDNLLADRRADEAEEALGKLAALPDANPVMTGIYRAHIALARYDEKTADGIVEELGREYPDNDVYLFEAAQYYAKKCEYEKAVALYERDFAIDTRRPRFQDALMGISQICEIAGDYGKAAETYGRIVDLLENEWGITEGTEYDAAIRERDRLNELARKKTR